MTVQIWVCGTGYEVHDDEQAREYFERERRKFKVASVLYGGTVYVLKEPVEDASSEK